ncbi:hypothetical protein WJX84_004479 [Apatococcus fuscideae]|uniref:Uncharacterized protein n=1 Tax=Apatococcus fuscideae TaxID=2026836 RepID=A0AAW1SNL7_9CHLO
MSRSTRPFEVYGSLVAEAGTQVHAKFLPLIVALGRELQRHTAKDPCRLRRRLVMRCVSFGHWSILLDGLEATCANLVCQLGALCSKETRKSTILQGEQASTAFKALAKGCGLLLAVEMCISQNPNLAAGCAAYTRMLQHIQAGQEDGTWSEEDASQAGFILTKVKELEARLMGRGVFHRFLDAYMSPTSQARRACCSAEFVAASASIAKAEMKAALQRIQDAAERPSDRSTLVNMLCFTVIHCRLCSAEHLPDRKLLRMCTDLHTQVPLLPIFSEVMLQPASFLSHYLPTSVDASIPRNFTRQAAMQQKESLEAQLDSYWTDLQQISLVAATWFIQMTHSFPAVPAADSQTTENEAGLTKMTAVLPGALRAICHAASLVKAVESAYEQQGTGIARLLPHLLAHSKSGIQGLLGAVNAGLHAKQRSMSTSRPLLQTQAARRQQEARLADAMTAVNAAQDVIQAPLSEASLIMMTIVLDALATTTSVSVAELERLEFSLHSLETLAHVHRIVPQAADASFLYFQRDLLQPAFASLYKSPAEAHKLPNLIAAFLDSGRILRHAGCSTNSLWQGYDREVLAALGTAVLEPLCAAMEAMLRLQITCGEETKYSIAVQPPVLHPSQSHEGPDMLDIATNLQQFASSFTLELATQTFVERPAAAPGNRHLATLSVAEALDTLRRHGLGAVDAIASHVCSFIFRQVSLLSKVLRGEHLQARLQQELRFTSQLGQAMGQGAREPVAYPMHRAELLASDVRRLGLARGNLSYLDFCGVLVSELGNALGLLRLAQQGRLELASTAASGIPGLNSGTLPTACHGSLDRDHLPSNASDWGGGSLPVDQDERDAEAGPSSAAAKASGGAPRRPPQDEPGSVAWAEQGLQDRLSHLHECVTGGLDPMADLAAGLQSVLHGPVQEPTVRSPTGSEGGSPRQHESLSQGSATPPASTSADSARQLRTHLSPRGKGAERGWPHLALFHVAVPAMTLGAVQRLLLEQEQLSRSRRPGQPSTAAFADGGFPLGLAFLLQALQQEPAFEALRWFQSVREHYTAQRREAEASGQGGARGGSTHWRRMGWLAEAFGHDVPAAQTSKDTNTLLRLKRVQACRDGFASLQHGLATALGLLPPLSHLNTQP